MKVRFNKFLAVLTCIAIMLSVAVPIIAMTYTDDACCEQHEDAHECCDHEVVGSDDGDDGDNAADPGSECADCGGDPCICSDYPCADGCEHSACLDCMSDPCTCADCACEEECDHDDDIDIDSDLCACEDCTCEDCDGADCECSGSGCSDCEGCFEAPPADVSKSSAAPRRSSTFDYTWEDILNEFFVPDGATPTVVADGIVAGGRTENWHGLGVDISALRALSTSKDIVITGTITGGGSWVAFEIWRDGDDEDEIQGSSASVTIPAAASFADGTEHRLVANSNGAVAPSFKITDITVGGVSIVPVQTVSGVAPIFVSKAEGGQGFTTGSFAGNCTYTVETAELGGLTNTLRAVGSANTNWQWAISISFANLGITTPGNYTVSFTYFVPTANLNGRDATQICANNAGNFDIPGLTNVTGQTYSDIAVNAWTTRTITFNANTAASGWDSGALLRIQPNDGAGFATAWYLSSVVVTKNSDLCSIESGHTSLARATCTAAAARCAECNFFNAPSAALGHDFRPHNSSQHRCARAGCGHLESHSPNGPGDTCATATCGFTQPQEGQEHECAEWWGEPGPSGATCGAGGTSTRECTFPGCTNTTSTDVPALGHSLSGGSCVRCGASPCGMCGTVGNWHWGGNAGSHWAGNCACPDYEPHFFSGAGICKCGQSGSPSVPPTACGICGTVGPWSWGGNEDVHWAANCACTGYASHSYNAAGVCICGATGTPGSGGGGGGGGAPSACAMCGVVGPWSWGGNADSHWADNCNCPGNAPHVFNAAGICICGATGTPSGGDGTSSPCAICGVVGPWSWGGNETVHWADNCNCTGNAPHSFNAAGICICGASGTPGTIVAPQDSFREEDFIDAEALLDDLQRAIDAGEVPTIDLTQAGRVTIISADILRAIADSGVDVMVVLPSGFTFTIVASSITANVGAFDLNIEVIIKYNDVQLETIGGGKVDIAANSIVFRPNFHGDFGFEIIFTVTAEQIANAGIDIDTVRLYHVDAAGNVTDLGRPTINDDGSLNFPISYASFYVLSSDPPVTTEIGTGVIGPDGADNDDGEQGGRVILPTQLEIAQQAESIAWILVTVSAVAVIAAAAVTVILLKRRRDAKTTPE